MDYHKTRDIINECDTYILFPKSNPSSCNRFIKEYVDIDKNLLSFIKKMKGNKFMKLVIHKTAPAYLMSEKEIMLI